jgi:hypothetical protein
MASQPPPPPPQYPPPYQTPYPGQPGWAPSAPPQKSRTGLYVVVVVIIVIVILVIAGLAYEAGRQGPGGTGSALQVQSHQQSIDNTANQPFGPGKTNAGVFAISIPFGATAAWVNGTFSVTTCTSIGDYCLAYAMIMTATAYENYASGGTVTTIWCATAGSSSCQAEQTVTIATGNISGQAGTALDLVLVSGATTLSQQYSTDVTLYWDTESRSS